jgi:hypothetical protein
MLKQKDLDVSQINYILNKKSKIEMRIKEYTEFLVDQCPLLTPENPELTGLKVDQLS